MMLQAIQEENTACFPEFGNACHDAHSAEVSVNVKHTFIELVATPRHARRLRSLTDTELLLAVKNMDTMETSDTSTGERSDTAESDAVESQSWAEWASPSWGPSDDDFYSNSVVDTFALPLASYEMAMDQSLSIGWPSDSCHWSAMPNNFFPMQCSDGGVWQESHSDNFQSVRQSVHNCNAGRPARTHSDAVKTTIMLRKLPSKFTRAHVIELLEDEGFEGSYDLVYLPMDFSGKSCLGYCFVNFKEVGDVNRAWEVFDGFCSWDSAEQTAVEVVWSDPHQGLEALVERYRNSPVMHESVPEEWKPAYFVDGAQAMFPAPTEKVKAPKQKSARSTAKKERR